MSNFTKRIEDKKEVREKKKTSHEILGKFFYDLAKITFPALVVGSIISAITHQQRNEFWLLTICGAFAAYAFAYVGYKIIKS